MPGSKPDFLLPVWNWASCLTSLSFICESKNSSTHKVVVRTKWEFIALTWQISWVSTNCQAPNSRYSRCDRRDMWKQLTRCNERSVKMCVHEVSEEPGIMRSAYRCGVREMGIWARLEYIFTKMCFPCDLRQINLWRPRFPQLGIAPMPRNDCEGQVE